MDYLWTPWRYAYIAGESKSRAKGVPPTLTAWLDADPERSRSKDPDCVFCNMIAAVNYAAEVGMPSIDAERESLIVWRGKSIFLCLNRYPYSTGHILAIPYEHTDSLAKLTVEAAHELIATAQTIDSVLRTVYRPDGLNFGFNLGEAAGAGVASHLHLHALPRWIGDTNFMTAISETRVLPETLEATWQKLRGAFMKLESDEV